MCTNLESMCSKRTQERAKFMPESWCHPMNSTDCASWSNSNGISTSSFQLYYNMPIAIPKSRNLKTRSKMFWRWTMHWKWRDKASLSIGDSKVVTFIEKFIECCLSSDSNFSIRLGPEQFEKSEFTYLIYEISVKRLAYFLYTHRIYCKLKIGLNLKISLYLLLKFR